jgi:hypothetical protein
VGLGANRGPTTQGTRDRPSARLPHTLYETAAPEAKLRVSTTRTLGTAVALALLLGISLFDQKKLLPRGVPPCLIIAKQMVTAICRGAHQIHGLLAKLIAAQRHESP